jgi:hypothetical protein
MLTCQRLGYQFVPIRTTRYIRIRLVVLSSMNASRTSITTGPRALCVQRHEPEFTTNHGKPRCRSRLGHRQRKVFPVQRSQLGGNRDGGPRRPTSSEPLAGFWGAEGSGELLDWLEVRNRHDVRAVPGFADEGTGMILLDLPDSETTRAANREIGERMMGLIDVLSECSIRKSTPMPPCLTTSSPRCPRAQRLPDPAGLPRRRHAGGAEPDRQAPGRGHSAGAGVAERHPGARWAGEGAGHWRLRRRGNWRGQGPRRHPTGCDAAAGPVPAPGCGRHPGLGTACRGLRRGRGSRGESGVEGPAGRGTGRRGQRSARGGSRRPVLPAGVDPAHRLARHPLAGPLPARSAEAAESAPAPRGGPARMPPSGILPMRHPMAPPVLGGPSSAAPPARAGSSCRMPWTRPLRPPG